MARFTDPAAQPFYAAAERFVEDALRRDNSIFTPGRAIWSAANLDDLYRRFTLQWDVAGANFTERLRAQLAGAPDPTVQLAAEVIYAHLLIATGNIGGDAKRKLVQQALGMMSAPVALPKDLARAMDAGLARVGTAYLTYRPYQVAFLIDFARAWKQLPQGEREHDLADPWAFKAMVFALPIDRAYAQREALLHMVHPDTFEAIVSREHKRKFAAEHASLLSDKAESDVDRRLLDIRSSYAAQHGGRQIDFYHPAQPITPPAVLGEKLRPYVELAARLDDDAYTPEQIVDVLGRISPPLVDLSDSPDPAALAEDMLLLRLLEPLEGGRYRRWAHLADATVEHMLRYAALAMLVPTDEGGYRLPIVAAPMDGQPYPAEAWPLGQQRLGWYAEAGLAQQNPDGTWQALPGALKPIGGETVTARAIASFLSHLGTVRRSLRDLPPLADGALGMVEPATLDERIGEIQRELLIDRGTILRIYRALLAGQHVILSGPPGTGKTHLAKLIPRVLWRDMQPTVVKEMPADPTRPPTDGPVERRISREGYLADVVTATEDWGVRHVVGGIVPQIEPQADGRRGLVYRVAHGCLTRAALANYQGYAGEGIPAAPLARQEQRDAEGRRYRGRWLVIDEFTRAPVDAAFGGLLTTLGGQRSPLAVPTDSGGEAAVPLPQDFRIIGTLNSFDRHFLNQISEAMKRRFTFIDVLPPARDQRPAERGVVVYRALAHLGAHGLIDPADHTLGRAVWEDVLEAARQSDGGYAVTAHDPEAGAALESLWRLLDAVRVYRQLGTAQAEALCAALLTGQIAGMGWGEALDTAFADVLADQLQVIGRDEQRALLAYLGAAGDATGFEQRLNAILDQLPAARQAAHLGLLHAALGQDEAAERGEAKRLPAEQLAQLFALGQPLLVGRGGAFGRRLAAMASERGL